MTTFRREKISEAIRKVITEKLIKDSSPIPKAIVTVNKVDLSPDFALAKIFYSVFGNDFNEISANSLMKKCASDYRHEISQKLNLRRTPRVQFCFDKNTEYAFKIDELLNNK